MKSTLICLLFLWSNFVNAQNALLFDGIDDYVQCPSPGPAGNASRTVEAWVKIPSLSTTQKVILDWGDMLTGGRFTLNIINGLPRIEVGGNGFSSTSAISINTWHHIAATFNNTATPKLKLYVDGNMAASGNPSVATFTNTTNGIIIGRRNDQINSFLGAIDEVKIWSIERSQTQIASDMNENLCTPLTGLVAYFNFNQGTAGGTNTGLITLTNQANSTNNGTLHNFSLSGSSSNWTSGQSMNNLAASTSQVGNTLTAIPAGASYQWINCSTGNSIIAGATNSTFTATTSGAYAVIVTKNACIDTSACINLTVSIKDENANAGLTFFPNPFTDEVQVDFLDGKLHADYTYRFIDAMGNSIRFVEQRHENGSRFKLDRAAAGIYFMEISSKDAIYRSKLIRK